ncbi:hypothetical protein BD770DRAFT_137536 [Pilaira anomala]|nr:hypothetical protein BD770DRAFT_137536 [Pilaira anomala]
MNKTVVSSSFELFNPTYTKYLDTPLYSPMSVFQPETDYFQGYSSFTNTAPIVPSQIDMYHMPVSPASSCVSTPSSYLSNQVNKAETEAFLPEFHQYSKELYENGNLLKKRRRRRFDESHLPVAEVRRQVHIESEKKRRAQIKQGFDALRQQLPGVSKKMSKVGLLEYTVQHLKHFKKSQSTILFEIERLVQDNQRMKEQQGILI